VRSGLPFAPSNVTSVAAERCALGGDDLAYRHRDRAEAGHGWGPDDPLAAKGDSSKEELLITLGRAHGEGLVVIGTVAVTPSR
jgi:hypothetical protein